MVQPGMVQPRIGVLFVTSGWFREVGLQAADSETTNMVEEAAQRTIAFLSPYIDIIGGRVIFSEAEAEKESRKIRDADVDGILLAPLMWCEDSIVRAALRRLTDKPILLMTFCPEPTLPDYVPFQTGIQFSGAVCTLQLSGMLKREGYSYFPVAGSLEKPEVLTSVLDSCRAMAIASRFKHTRVGVLPFPCSQMSTTYVDEFGLRTLYGIELVYLEIDRLKHLASGVSAPEIDSFTRKLRKAGIRIEVDETNLTEGIRYAIGMERLFDEAQIDILSMNDVIHEMHESLGLRPSLTHPGLGEKGRVVSMEADIAAGVCMFALRLFTGNIPFYTEPISVDMEKNLILLGHAGYHDYANSDPETDIKIIPDVEYKNTDRFSGAVTYFKYAAGPVTVVNSVWDGRRLKWVLCEGEALGGGYRLEGNSHAVWRPDIPLTTFFETAAASGVSQHWIIIPGRIAKRLNRILPILSIAGETIQ